MKRALHTLGMPVAVGAILGLAMLYWQSPPASKVKVGATVPELTLPSHGGGPTTLSNLRGRVVILVAFQADCEECAAQMRTLESLHRIYVHYGLAVIGLSLDHDRQAENGFLDRHHTTFIVLDDPDGRESSPVFGRLHPPEAYLIDAAGRVVEVYHGPVDWRAKDTMERVRGLLLQSGRTVP